MYSAKIIKVTNLQPHPNADKLQLLNYNGLQFVVGLDCQVGDIVILFPVDGKLSHDMLRNNNLYRDATKNVDPLKTGFFEDNGKIRTQKFRGELSQGFVIGLRGVEWATSNWQKLEVGLEFTEINGHVICEKYMTPATIAANRNAKNKTKKSNNVERYIQKHYDTEQLAYNLDKLPSSGLVIVTEKVHGCLNSRTKITMSDGSKIKIKNIVNDNMVGSYVLGVSQDGSVVKSKIKNVYNNGRYNKWLDVKIQSIHGNNSNRSRSSVICTPNHKFLTSTGYISANCLQKNQIVYFLRNDPKISNIAKQVLIGKLLGDGSLTISESLISASITFSHKESHVEYLLYTLKLLGNLGCNTVDRRTSGYGTNMVRAHTVITPEIKTYFEKFFDSNTRKRIIPESVIDDITPIALAFWYMDDGSLSHTDKQQDRANIAICRYDESYNDTIKRIFEKFGISVKFYTDSNGYNRLRINYKSADIFFNLIYKYIPKCMQYKLPKKYRGFEPELLCDNNEMIYTLCEQKILSVNEYDYSNDNSTRYDIETETGNFFANGILVHNSSGITGYVKVETQHHTWFKTVVNNLFKRAVLKPKVTSTYDYVTCTRNTVCNDREDCTNPEGAEYYRWQYHNKFIGTLKKGETIYYEICGYSNTNKPIMNQHNIKSLKDKSISDQFGNIMTYSYGCDPLIGKQNRIFVYRITQQNESNEITELSWHQIQQRCIELGLETVPVLDITYVKEGMKDHVENVDKRFLNNSPSTIDSRHLMEGAVFRFESSSGVRVYKKKNTAFLIMENILKEDDSVVDSEEIS